MLEDISTLTHMSLRTGKTTAICKAAKEIDALVITHSAQEAKRLKKEFGVRAISFDSEMRGRSGPILVDTHAVSAIAWEFEKKLKQKNDHIKRLQTALKKALGIADEL